MSANLSAILRNGTIVALTLVACVAGGLTGPRADVPRQAPGAAPFLQLAQDNAAWCRNSASRINAMRSRYNSSCSGSLSREQYARCQQMRRELDDVIARHNASCR